MQKVVYVALFTFLGILMQFFVHGVIEIVYITLLLSDFDTFGLGFSFATWFLIHNVFTVVVLVLGITIGFQQGNYWWKKIYGGTRR